MSKYLLASVLWMGSILCADSYPGTLTISHHEPGGIGYNRGYTSADFFYSSSCNQNWYPFIDLRGHVFNNGKWASNVGLGLRYLSDCQDVIYGLNVYWDWRRAAHASFQQLGVGLEVLWPCWDLTVNGYAPLSRQKKGYRTGFDHFEGHEAIVFKKYELAMSGLDAALGYWFWRNDCFGIHGSIGGYYFRGNFNKQAGGGLLRGKVRLTDWVTIEGQVSYDSLFKWNGQGVLALNIPLGSRRCRSCIEDRLSERPERFEIIVTTNHKRKARADHPLTGNPLTFFFVDNTSSSDGTFESPFPTLAQAQGASGPENAIYVFPGDGTDTGMNAGVILKDLQILAGSGAPLEVQSRFGLIEIPRFTIAKPKLSNGGTTVTLANQNSISGLSITSTAGAGIGDATFVEGLTLRDNQITAATTGVLLTNGFTGTFKALNNWIDAQNPGILFSQAFEGVFFAKQNRITSATQEGIAFAKTFDGQFSARGNQITSEFEGILVFDPFTGNFRATSNQISTNSRAGIRMNKDFTGNFEAQNNQISSDAAEGVVFSLQATGNFIFQNNSISTLQEGIRFVGGFDGDFIFVGNSITTVDRSALSITSGTALTFGTGLILKNSLSQSTGSANPTLNIASLEWVAVINDNFLSNPGAGLAAQIGHTGTPVQVSHIQFAHNILTTPNAASGHFLNVGGVLEVESPNLALSGLNQINTGTITESGVTFVPFRLIDTSF